MTSHGLQARPQSGSLFLNVFSNTWHRKMPSDTESSSTSSSEVEGNLNTSSDCEDVGKINTQFLPYQDEPLASDAANVNILWSESEENTDPDSLSPDVLAARWKGETPLSDW